MDQKVFKPESETIEEFLQRFKVQNWSTLNALKPEDVQKKAMLLVNALPVEVVTDIQRKLVPKDLTDATFENIETELKSLFSKKKSLIGCAVSFFTRKQRAGESIEEFAKSLNQLSSQCSYGECCRSTVLRDCFVAGLRSPKIMTTLIHECEGKTFSDVLNRAKVIEQVNVDLQEINPDVRSQNMLQRNNSNSKSGRNKNNGDKQWRNNSGEVKPISNRTGYSVSPNYVCGRCLTAGKHNAANCFAKNLTCNGCKMKGHISKACRNNQQKKEEHTKFKRISETQNDDNLEKYFVMNYVGRKSTMNRRPPSMDSLDEFPTLPATPSMRTMTSCESINRYSALTEDHETSFSDDFSGDMNNYALDSASNGLYSDMLQINSIKRKNKKCTKNSHFLG